MAYKLQITPDAVKALARIPNPDRQRIKVRIDGLALDPRPAGAAKLVGAPGWRVRQGNYRIVYLIDDTITVVTVTRIAPRGSVYR